MSHILIVDGCEPKGKFLQTALREVYPSLLITLKPTAELGLAVANSKQCSVDLIIASDRLPGASGLEFCRKLRKTYIDIPFILITESGGEPQAIAAMRCGVTDYIVETKLDHLKSYLIKTIPSHLQLWKRRLKISEEINELKAQNLELQNQNRSLTNFTRAISHDLVTPLSQMAGFADLLQTNHQRLTPERQNRYLEQIQSIAYETIERIDVLRNLTSAENEIQTERCNTQTLLVNAIDQLEENIREREGIIELIDHLPDTIGRPDWIETIWINLISFCLIHAASSPLIRIRHQVSLHNQTVHFVVECTPLKVSNQTKRILMDTEDEFHDEISHPTSEAELVLIIVKRIIELLGGSIGIHTTQDHFVSIYFELMQPGRQVSRSEPRQKPRLTKEYPLIMPHLSAIEDYRTPGKDHFSPR